MANENEISRVVDPVSGITFNVCFDHSSGQPVVTHISVRYPDDHEIQKAIMFKPVLAVNQDEV